MKKVLITGITGFAGSFLSEHLSSFDDLKLFGTYLSESSTENISSIKDKLELVKIDLTDSDRVNELITSIKPDQIYHLAALPSPADSHQNPVKYIHNNVDVQLNILESIKSNDLLDTRTLIVSSAEIYGAVSSDQLPISENTQFRPNSPYSVSKATQDLLGLQYFLSYNLPIIRVRPFNHIGPRQSPAFVVSAFAKQIAEIEKNEVDPVIYVGNLDAKRDFTDVRDIVKAYRIAMENGKTGEVYNVGRGESFSIKSILDKLISLSSVEMRVEEDPSRLRPSDVPDLVSNSTKIKELGWDVTIDLEDTLQNTLDYWRAIV